PLAGCGPETPERSEPDPRLAASRDAARQLGSELKTRLQSAMGTEGPVAAVSVCAEEAPAIAARLSAGIGADVGRTALKYRNPDNAPADWQADVLRSFAERLADGADPAALEFSATTDNGGFRYMKAILTAPACLACHGDVPAGPLADAIASSYPDDLATGFAAGELRGAFVVEWSDSP
ncbi:MAG: DUF3365 domain-containing protein, partial [Gammaproteobacteria bacterium]|nr:DUF3365 domain-containing protein [Gammaproteobacteria bacterium]